MSNIDKTMGIKFLTRCLAIAVCTKNSNWNDDEYQNGVIEPYRKIHKMVEDLEKEDIAPTIDQLHQAFDMLKSVFVTKGTSSEEQMERFNQIFAETKLDEHFPDFKKS
jgi:[acyl-carrier-protein] S-malonyltransferase